MTPLRRGFLSDPFKERRTLSNPPHIRLPCWQVLFIFSPTFRQEPFQNPVCRSRGHDLSWPRPSEPWVLSSLPSLQGPEFCLWVSPGVVSWVSCGTPTGDLPHPTPTLRMLTCIFSSISKNSADWKIQAGQRDKDRASARRQREKVSLLTGSSARASPGMKFIWIKRR